MKWIFILTLALSSPTLYAQIYKCSLPNGEQLFQGYPCNEVETEEVELNQQSVISNDNYQKNIQIYESQINTQNYRSRSDEIRRETDEKICSIYKDHLTSIEERWKTLKRQGYKQSEKDRYEQRIRDAERDVERKC